jgi:acetyl esterase/lipase
VLLHGGFWRARFSLEHLEPAADDLVGRGYTVWNLEYRGVGQGPWPSTLDDVAAGIDHLATLDVPAPAVLVGHSAGGHLAVWAAGRPGDAAPVARVISLAGVLDLDQAARERIGEDAAREFVGGGPDDFPERYAQADPSARLPLGLPVRCVHAQADDRVPYAQSARYVAAARAAGDDAQLRTVPGDHFTVVDPTAPAWETVVDLLR